MMLLLNLLVSVSKRPLVLLQYKKKIPSGRLSIFPKEHKHKRHASKTIDKTINTQ